MAAKAQPTTYDPRAVEIARYKQWRSRGYFRAVPDAAKTPWAVMMPLPNVTGELHIGHAMNNTLQDLLTRLRRMQGFSALYQPGTDHAGIATQNVVERELAKEGLRPRDIGREGFETRVWEWVRKYGSIIYNQLERLGISCDWDRKAFTLDPHYQDAVLEAFVRLYDKGLIYRGKYMVNWCPKDQTAISDLEVEYEEVDAQLWYVRYPGADGGPGVVIATQRPETILADVAVAVHPDDARSAHLVGTEVLVPITNRRVPVIADRRVDPEFGTGALKITPGHDPLDYDIGADHHLPILVILDPQAKMTADAGKYAGMDRFAARRTMAADLQAMGLIERVEPYRTNVGTCDRCHTVIEPYISDQWFCDVREMAARAADAIRSGKVRFYDPRWARVALQFLDNIRPWTISRQLWWGHRIPVWQCDACGERTAAKTPPASCRACGATAFRQDPDVLDTWFSSALWPFATLGWPQETDDLRYFYPTTILITDRGIIQLWVCRMIMFGLEFMGDVPFHDVYINPTVMDLKGRRMSKSLGTGVDPLDAVDRFGADALRFGLVVRCSQAQQDLRFEEKMVADVRNFSTKIWNAARFVLMNLNGTTPLPFAGPAGLSVADRWIRSRYARLRDEVTGHLDGYEFDKAARALYDFIWSEYCDWYLEMAKIDLQHAPDAARRSAVQETLASVLSNTMTLLHPIMPFITEEVWGKLPHAGDSLMVAPWPDPRPEWFDPKAEAELGAVMDVIRAIRGIRAELSVPPTQTIPVVIRADRAHEELLMIPETSKYIATLGRVSTLKVEGPSTQHPAQSAGVVLPGIELFVVLSGVADPRNEQQRLTKVMEHVASDLERLRSRMNNEEFLSRAPAEVVAKERERIAELESRRRRLEELLRALRSPS